MQRHYTIVWGKPIIWEIQCFGAKNFATKAIIASLLSSEKTILTNVPDIGDVHITLDMLNQVGVTYRFDKESNILEIDPSTMEWNTIGGEHSGRNRMPILLLNPILHKFGYARVPGVWWCPIGARTVDFHLAAVEKFGWVLEETSDAYVVTSQGRLQWTTIELPYPSVGATETCLMLSVLSQGNSIIKNIAIEPEIIELITMLRSMGAIIFLQDDRTLKIEWVEKLHGTRMNILGDRIEAASRASLACATDGNIIVKWFRPDTLWNFLAYYEQIGWWFEILWPDSMRFFRQSKVLKPCMLETNIWPWFSTDRQQPFCVTLTQAEWVSVIHETVYESRFGYLMTLNEMGAKAQLSDYCLWTVPCRFKNKSHKHSAIVTWPTPLHGIEKLVVPDLRAWLAYYIASAVAQWTTNIYEIEKIERGYGDLPHRLSKTNADITLVE
jgi:UDP-N-acetylglucosamine 1-carboxyvinyltransferase